MDSEILEDLLRVWIDDVRETHPSGGQVALVGWRERKSAPPLTISLARFQSYRARTEAALVQELLDYIEEAGLTEINYKVLDIDQVLVW